MEDLGGARAFGQADERMGYKDARKIICGRQTPDNTSYRGVSSLQAKFFLSAPKYTPVRWNQEQAYCGAGPEVRTSRSSQMSHEQNCYVSAHAYRVCLIQAVHGEHFILAVGHFSP